MVAEVVHIEDLGVFYCWRRIWCPESGFSEKAFVALGVSVVESGGQGVKTTAVISSIADPEKWGTECDGAMTGKLSVLVDGGQIPAGGADSLEVAFAVDDVHVLCV